ncbi:hypothetical protein [Desulfoluna spongiiphila]|uniref:hypothetical protein n=1 Tax=Desulfoluna spongiiphila TaxID=419481 RepID=UPI001255A889|nr:hypothetical protein [Desulfoluna spongiiphila]VVS95370.1 hypothetical protein DBB_49470 [Desulfoluna spongiiphila]
MNDTKNEDPLLEWNRLNIENTEQAFVSALYQSTSENTSQIKQFSMWLLTGTGACGALLITQIKSVLPFLTSQGIKVCISFLVLSALSGLISKYKALRCEIQLNIQQKLNLLLSPVFQNLDDNQDKIENSAKQRGIKLETDISFDKVITEFSKALPWWSKILVARKVKQQGGDVQAGHRMAFKAFLNQISWAFYQACFFVAFLLAGAWYARTI